MSDAPTQHPKLEKMGTNLMEGFPEGVKAFLFMVVSDSLPLQEMWRSGDMEKGTGGDGKRVLGIWLCRRQSPTTAAGSAPRAAARALLLLLRAVS